MLLPSLDSIRPVRVRVVDAAGKHVGGAASGFFLTFAQQTYLYTAWHVVTGVDWLNLRDGSTPNSIVPRHSIRVETTEIKIRQPGVSAIGGRREFEFALYHPQTLQPLWQQDHQSRAADGVAALGGGVPQFSDVVRLPVDLPDEYREALSVAIPDGQTACQIGTRLTIFGFPFGFSGAREDWVEAVALTRFVVGSWSSRSNGIVLVEPAAYPVMSGAPVFAEVMPSAIGFHQGVASGTRLLMGVYGGAIYPDAAASFDTHAGMTAAPLRPTLGIVYSLSFFHAIGLGLGTSMTKLALE